MVNCANTLTLALGLWCVPPAQAGASATQRTCSLSGRPVYVHTDQALRVFERLLSRDCPVMVNPGKPHFSNHAIAW